MRSSSKFKSNALLGTLLHLVVWSTLVLLGISNAYAKPATTRKKYKAPIVKVQKSKVKKSYVYKKRYLPIKPTRVIMSNPRDIKVEKSYSSKLELVSIIAGANGPNLSDLPKFESMLGGRVAGVTARRDLVLYSVDPGLQAFAEALIKKSPDPHIAIVAMEPSTGRILAIADKSTTIPALALHAGFPAASLFKLVTTTAALEANAISPYTQISFRGGNYVLNEWNYRPNPKSDKRSMSVTEALGKSVNPVFARIALKHLSTSTLRQYAQAFGFNSEIEFDTALAPSSASIPFDDYGLSRTAAGFGEVHISPVHAAALMSGIANDGLMPRPTLIERILSASGETLYQPQDKPTRRIARSATAQTLLRMMQSTTTTGTSRKEFMIKSTPVLPGISVAAKTGTLKGQNPAGLNNWFIGAAPLGKPRIAVSVIVVDPHGISTKASKLGRLMIQQYLK